MKALKASDEKWIEWIERSDPMAEKKWAYAFFGLYLITMAIGVIVAMKELTGAVIIIFGAHYFALMGMAKMNNFRLYRIIHSLLNKETKR